MEKNWGGKSPQLCICMTSVILKGHWRQARENEGGIINGNNKS